MWTWGCLVYQVRFYEDHKNKTQARGHPGPQFVVHILWSSIHPCTAFHTLPHRSPPLAPQGRWMSSTGADQRGVLVQPLRGPLLPKAVRHSPRGCRSGEGECPRETRTISVLSPAGGQRPQPHPTQPLHFCPSPVFLSNGTKRIPTSGESFNLFVDPSRYFSFVRLPFCPSSKTEFGVFFCDHIETFHLQEGFLIYSDGPFQSPRVFTFFRSPHFYPQSFSSVFPSNSRCTNYPSCLTLTVFLSPISNFKLSPNYFHPRLFFSRSHDSDVSRHIHEKHRLRLFL